MSTLSDLADRVQDRLEEPRGAGIFWDRETEIYPALVEAITEGGLIAGEPEVRANQPFTIPDHTQVLSLPDGATCLLGIDGPTSPVLKTTVWDLDRFTPGWEGVVAEPYQYIQFWFPIGLTKFGVYPQLLQPSSCLISYLAVPVPMVRPYTGSEYVPFQEEYLDGYCDCAAGTLRLKEATAEFQEGLLQYDKWLEKAQQLSRFSWRKGSLRFSKAVGAQAGITPVEQR